MTFTVQNKVVIYDNCIPLCPVAIDEDTIVMENTDYAYDVYSPFLI
jgi:hypothetical protein